MKKSNAQDATRYAIYFVANQTTLREVAKHFGVSKSYIHNILSQMSYKANNGLAKAVRELIEKNKQERHIRGGNATKLKYMKEKQQKKV